MINKAETGKRIASLRVGLGYSQAALAEKLNVTPQAVSKWETGQTLPDTELLLTISWMCRVPINEIIDPEEIFVDRLQGEERELIRMNRLLNCPVCGGRLSLMLRPEGSARVYMCDNRHEYPIEDGVVYFNTREIPGELWSLWLRNYEHYLLEATHPGNPRYAQGEVPCKEIMWREIERLRPGTIVDVACGTGSGIKYIMDRIRWPCTVILTDLSFRILAWNRRYLSENANPYVDLVYLACDCARMPLRDDAVDVVFSNGGFESMQDNMSAGFREAHRVLKPGGAAVYNMSLVDDHRCDNTRKWLGLMHSLPESYHATNEQMRDMDQWLAVCDAAGFRRSRSVKVYGELPAPDTAVFPFENEILQWMACHVVVSSK